MDRPATDMNRKQKRRTITFAVWGGVVIAVILLLTSIWAMNSARRGADQAVARVSDFYLEELAGKRAEVLSKELADRFRFMENALAILDASYL